MRTQTPAAEAPKQAPGSLAYNLAGIAVLVLLVAVGAAYLVDSLGRTSLAPLPDPADADTVELTISGTELAVPASWFRYGGKVQPGFSSQIDLKVMLELEGTRSPVDVTLLPRSRARRSSALLDGVYLHQFSEETLTGIAGLVGKPLLDSDGFAGESIWYDPLSANPFVAKCMEPVEAGAPAQCLRTVYLSSGIAAVYAFDAAALRSWRQFDAEMEKWLGRIGAW
jgi:hypothetical protein